MQQTAIDEDIWTGKRILKAYFEYIRPQFGRLLPKGFEKPNERSSPKFQAFVRVIRHERYHYHEEGLRVLAMSFQDRVAGYQEWDQNAKDFCDLLDESLVGDPFDPAPDVPKSHIGNACLSLSTSAALCNRHKSTVWRWVQRKMVIGKLGYQGEVWIQLDSLLKIMDRKGLHRKTKEAHRREAAQERKT